MAAPKKRFVQKKEALPRKPRPKKVTPLYTHPQLEKELVKTKLSFERLLKVVKDSDLGSRQSRFSWSVRELMTHIITDLETVLTTLSIAEKGHKTPRLPARLTNMVNFLSFRLRSRSNNHETLSKKYLQAHTQALELLSKISHSEMDRLVWTSFGQTTVAELFRDHPRRFAEHEAQIKRLLIRRN